MGSIRIPKRTVWPRGNKVLVVSHTFASTAAVVLHQGDCLEFLRSLPDGLARLIVTSPPYNIGKRYEKRIGLEDYLKGQERVIKECVRVLAEDGSICWQVGNFVLNNEIVPLDIALWPIFHSLGLKMRNRIIWHFEHGLHCSRRLSGRYETIVWFTKSDDHVFNLDEIRVPQKYPGKKHFKGPKTGQYSCNPKGKNPGDVWIIPNVKHNHIEKTNHPCQFPVGLIEKLVKALTNSGDYVLDPYMGVGTTAVAAILNNRKALGAEIVAEYVKIAEERIALAYRGLLRTRPMDRPVYRPTGMERVVQNPYSGDKTDLRLPL